MSNETTDKCPHCGAEETELLGLRYPSCRKFDDYGYILGDDDRSPLCHEREARQNVEKELAELRKRWPENMAIDYLQDCLKDAESENQQLRELLEDAICEFGKIAYWREGCHEHDDDMGHDRREFSDTEDWELLEANAILDHRALTEKLNQLTK